MTEIQSEDQSGGGRVVVGGGGRGCCWLCRDFHPIATISRFYKEFAAVVLEENALMMFGVKGQIGQ